LPENLVSRRTLLTLLAWFPGLGCGAAPPTAPTPDPQVMARLTQVRDAFTRRADEEGYRVCPAPAIELAAPASLGRFDPDSNTVLMASWSRLSAEQRQRFESLAAHTGGRSSAPAMFEDGTYRWAFVHELAHWWQTCRQLSRPRSYGAEAGANRIALAFWRERDPAFVARMLGTFRYLHEAMPSPLPAGMPKQQYFEDHFLAIAQGSAYTWYQADMTLELATEVPRPSFHKALSQPLYPW
jgi:hypothetical protein